MKHSILTDGRRCGDYNKCHRKLVKFTMGRVFGRHCMQKSNSFMRYSQSIVFYEKRAHVSAVHKERKTENCSICSNLKFNKILN